jgi:hypothetical protein
MIKKLQAAAYFSLALKYYRNDNIEKSRRYIEKHILLSKTRRATALAFRATLMLLDRDMHSSKDNFLTAIELCTRNDSNSDYVRSYCQYYLCLIDKDSDCDRLRRTALAVPASRRLKEWLVLPSVPIHD